MEDGSHIFFATLWMTFRERPTFPFTIGPHTFGVCKTLKTDHGQQFSRTVDIINGLHNQIINSPWETFCLVFIMYN